MTSPFFSERQVILDGMISELQGIVKRQSAENEQRIWAETRRVIDACTSAPALTGVSGLAVILGTLTVAYAAMNAIVERVADEDRKLN